MPKKFSKTGVTYKWHIDERFKEIPEIHEVDAHTKEIRLDPWKFAELMISKFKSNPALLEDATLHAFGEVRAD